MALENPVLTPSAANLRLARTRRLLSAEQQFQIAVQLDFHEGAPFCERVDLRDVSTLSVAPDVMRPMSSKVLARWILRNGALFSDRVVFDIGTGCGIQAVVCAAAGARKVVAGDVSRAATECAARNVQSLHMEHAVQIIQSDLFSGYSHTPKADVILFAQPFFSDEPIVEKPVSIGMLDQGVLVPRFLSEARQFLSDGGILLMMAWGFAGQTNDPRTYCRQFGYGCFTAGEETVSVGCQQGDIEILILQLTSALAMRELPVK